MKTAAVALFAAAVLAIAPLAAGEHEEEKATQAAEQEAKKAEMAGKTEKITGTIAKIDTEAQTIEVKEGERVAHLKLKEKTKIHRGEEQLKLTDLKIGDHVEVMAKGQIVQNIHLKPAEAKQEMKQEMKQERK